MQFISERKSQRSIGDIGPVERLRLARLSGKMDSLAGPFDQSITRSFGSLTTRVSRGQLGSEVILDKELEGAFERTTITFSPPEFAGQLGHISALRDLYVNEDLESRLRYDAANQSGDNTLGLHDLAVTMREVARVHRATKIN